MSEATTAVSTTSHDNKVTETLATKLDRALDSLASAKPFARAVYQTDVFQLAEALMGSAEGLRALYQRAGSFDEMGVFSGGPWEDPAKLQPPLVAGSLNGAGVYPVVETLSELRMLAIASGRAVSPRVSQQEALDFLNETMALNLQFLFPADTEQERIEAGPHRFSNMRLFALIAEELDLKTLHEEVVSEIDQICAQRPVMTQRVRRMIRMAERIPPDKAKDPDMQARLEHYSRAVAGPTPLCQSEPRWADYRQALTKLSHDQLAQEAAVFAASMGSTGLACAHHAILVRHLRRYEPELLSESLGLNEAGKASLEQHREVVHQLIKVAVLPGTAQALYGLARLLERGLLARSEVVVGLERLVDLDFQTEVRRQLLRQHGKHEGLTAHSILLAGALAVLGQPLGVGQGNNPTCQAARGISLWSEHAPGYLLEIVISAARDGLVETRFEGATLRTDQLASVSQRQLDTELDPVSLVLVPHLDKLYEDMMGRVALRPEDSHKWVNPGLYGRWVPKGFASAFVDLKQSTVADFEGFVRRFYATHHPAYNDGHRLMYPNPVGICVTNSHGDYLGPHAVSLRRVQEDPHGKLRAYFYNPNNEGRQDWGLDVKPTISGNGEEEGESSLPFADFTARLYAFHYNPFEEGDAYAVPQDTVAAVEEAAKRSWGQAFAWVA